MKIMVDIFKAFLTKVSIDKEVKDCLLNFSDNGVVILARSEKSIAVKGLLKSVSFTGYKNIGVVGIRDISKLVNYIDTLKGEISIKVKENQFIINDENIFWEYGLCDAEFIKSNLAEFPKYETTSIVDLTGDKLSMMKTLIKSVKSSEMSIVSNDKETEFIVMSDQDKGKMILPFSCGNPMTVHVAESFIKTLFVLGHNVQACFKNNSPIWFKDIGEFMEFEYIVANKKNQN